MGAQISKLSTDNIVLPAEVKNLAESLQQVDSKIYYWNPLEINAYIKNVFLPQAIEKIKTFSDTETMVTKDNMPPQIMTFMSKEIMDAIRD